MQYLFATLTLSALLTVSLLAQETGMPAQSLYALIGVMGLYVVVTRLKKQQEEN